MSCQSSEKKTLTTRDVTAYFSEEEWTLLQDWQKELYRNVMNEIHQALIALGPLIATSVSFSRAKEKKDVYPMNSRDSERRYSDDCCLKDAVDDVVLGIDQEKNKSMKNHQSTQRNEGCAKIQFPEADCRWRSPLKKQLEESLAVTGDLVIGSVVSFKLKEEDDACFMPLEDSGAKGNTLYPTNNASVRPPAMHRCLNEERKYFLEAERIESMNLGLNRPINSTKQQEANDWESKLTCDFGRSTSQKPKNHQKMCPLENSYASTEYKSSFNQKSHIPEHNDTKKFQNPYTVTECGTSLDESSKMERNQEINTALQMCICSRCGRCSNQPINMITDHLISNHQQPNVCSDCMKVVSFSSNLNKDQERPYKCSDCGQSFKTSQTLIRHRRIHTGERPYICIQCGKSFRRPHTLMTHQLLHTGDKPYSCVTCGRNFRQIPHLMKHQRTHMREKELE
ncbi:uncharacterized protein LOC144822316 [Lissotriton helveticus]